MTLIAAIVPAGVVTTHTIFCIRDVLDREAQEFLCSLFNSYIANYLVRMRVGTHVTAALMSELPVPKPGPGTEQLRGIARLTRWLSRRNDPVALAQLNARAARLYGLTEAQFRRVLATFPLVPAPERDAAARLFAENFPD
jgi:hypothetical protein